MKTIKLAVGTLVIAVSAAGAVHAAPLGVVQTFPDITLTSQVFYDANGVDDNTGLLTVMSSAATLAEGVAAGGASDTQSYFGTGDSARDLTLTFHVRNGLGGYTAGSFVAGSVSIGYGNATAEPRYSWQGTMTGFGFADSGASAWKYFDATWDVTGDTYQNMPTVLSQFSNGYLTGGDGGLKINLTNAITANQFATDWSRTSGVTIDVWAAPVPEMDSAAFLAIGFAALVPLVRRRKTR